MPYLPWQAAQTLLYTSSPSAAAATPDDAATNASTRNFLGDGAYDTHQTFQLVQKQMNGKDPPGIKVRKNSVITGNTPRDLAVKERKELGYEKWRRRTRRFRIKSAYKKTSSRFSEKHSYGKRWMTETFFSSVKRCFAHRFSEVVFEQGPSPTARKPVRRNTESKDTGNSQERSGKKTKDVQHGHKNGENNLTKAPKRSRNGKDQRVIQHSTVLKLKKGLQQSRITKIYKPFGEATSPNRQEINCIKGRNKQWMQSV
ncbi:MAG: hypothetical protein MAG715_00223 [Methanonatronarchaeales archaeon]|nr:hypothetical protein [Methanonatronarchaeales archaeon]